MALEVTTSVLVLVVLTLSPRDNPLSRLDPPTAAASLASALVWGRESLSLAVSRWLRRTAGAMAVRLG